jgi:hypothetical protein
MTPASRAISGVIATTQPRSVFSGVNNSDISFWPHCELYHLIRRLQHSINYADLIIPSRRAPLCSVPEIVFSDMAKATSNGSNSSSTSIVNTQTRSRTSQRRRRAAPSVAPVDRVIIQTAMSKLIETIAEKAARLPPEQQREALAFIESLTVNGEGKHPLRSVRGIMQMNLENFDEDLKNVRQDMWRDFPREEPR